LAKAGISPGSQERVGSPGNVPGNGIADLKAPQILFRLLLIAGKDKDQSVTLGPKNQAHLEACPGFVMVFLESAQAGRPAQMCGMIPFGPLPFDSSLRKRATAPDS
jgi:hypothetical protein